ncbi:MAG: hypothetical protein WCK96_16730 [Methylococcales bacterium]
MLKSKLLSANQRLNNCEVQDSAHVCKGDTGEYVSRIQQALIRIDNAKIADAELSASRYGESTAAAVLRYKTPRKIINTTYQKSADDIVGKMTIKKLDEEMLVFERGVSDEFFAIGLRSRRRQF